MGMAKAAFRMVRQVAQDGPENHGPKSAASVYGVDDRQHQAASPGSSCSSSSTAGFTAAALLARYSDKLGVVVASWRWRLTPS
jgi:hypothetical protein